MTNTVYVDRLLAVNVLLGVLLLLSASRLCGITIKKWGLIAGSLLSSASSLLIFLPPSGFFVSVLIRLACSAVIVSAAFFPKSLRAFFRSWAAFFAVNFIYAGIILAAGILLPVGVVASNGAVYFDISAIMLCVLFGLSYGALLLYRSYAQSRTPPSDKIPIRIEFDGRAVFADALIDTGSTLTEGFSGRPVVIAELSLASGLLENCELEVFKSGGLSGEISQRIGKGFRLVPYSTIAGEGAVPSFRADCVCTAYGGKKAENVYIGVVNRELSGGEYRAIAGKGLFDE